MHIYHRKGKKAGFPVRIFLLAAATILAAALIPTEYALLYGVLLAFSVCLQTMLVRLSYPLLCLPITAVALSFSFLVSGKLFLLVPLVSVPLAALFLARLWRRDEWRTAMADTLTVVFAAAFVLAAVCFLLPLMQADGEGNLLTYLDRTMDKVLTGLSAQAADFLVEINALYPQQQQMLVVSQAEIKEIFVAVLALTPGMLLGAMYIFSLAITYLLQLLCGFMDSGCGFSKKNCIYRPSVLLAVAYIFSVPMLYLWGDYRNAFCLVCLNLVAFVTPLFAFGVLCEARSIFSFIRHISFGRIDFIIFSVLLCLFVLFYMGYALPLMATGYAIYLLKSAISAKRGEK